MRAGREEHTPTGLDGVGARRKDSEQEPPAYPTMPTYDSHKVYYGIYYI